METKADVRILLFDLGGVLLRLNDPVECFGLAGSLPEFQSSWLKSQAVREFESGHIDTEQFAKKAVVEAGLPYDWQEFVTRFDAWPDRLFERALPVLHAIPDQYRCALLSNINALHWGRENIARPLENIFDKVFLSFETGYIKPDHDSFAQVTKYFECRPCEVLFFDDSAENVEAADVFGLQTVHCQGMVAVENALRERGILS